MREIEGWSNLGETVRSKLIRSCTQQTTNRNVDFLLTLQNELLKPIQNEIFDVCSQLEKIRHTKGGKKKYHLMISSYFLDSAQTWNALRRVCASPSDVCFIIGDSAPYGIYVPVHEWLGKLAIAAGFESWSFERIRDRNIKWKNRKHNVPLCEGRLWVKG